MARFAVYLSLALVVVRTPQPYQCITLLVLIVINTAITLRQLHRQLTDLDLDLDLDLNANRGAPRAAPEIHESSESEEEVPDSPRPQPCHGGCFLCELDDLIAHPMPNDSASGSSFASQSDESEFVDCEEAASVGSLEEIRQLVMYHHAVEEQVRSRKNSASSSRQNSLSSQEALTTSQLEPFPPFPEMPAEQFEVAEDVEKEIRLRNLRMREEGVRVKVSRAQLSGLTQTTRPLPPAPPAPVQPSPPSSGASNSSFSSSLQPSTPAATPYDLTGITTPDQRVSFLEPQQRPTSSLPTSGRAGSVLDRIDEKLLAVPADAVSRRLLRDGRAMLRRGGRLPKSISFAGGMSVRQTQPTQGGQENGELEASYPSDMME